jgi:hypothetical protein
MELYLNNQFTRTMNTMALPLSKMQGNVVSKGLFLNGKKSVFGKFYKWKVSQRDQHDYTWYSREVSISAVLNSCVIKHCNFVVCIKLIKV